MQFFLPYLHSIFITMSLSVPAACFFVIQIKLNWIFSMCCERKGSEKKLCLLGQYLLRPAGKTASMLEMNTATQQCQAVSGASKDGSCKQIQGKAFCISGHVAWQTKGECCCCSIQ